MRISDWSSDVCSSDLLVFYGNHDADYGPVALEKDGAYTLIFEGRVDDANPSATYEFQVSRIADKPAALTPGATTGGTLDQPYQSALLTFTLADDTLLYVDALTADRSEEHTSELQSLMRNSYAVFCLKKKKKKQID